jgi:trk system potassium uptake protein TrkH
MGSEHLLEDIISLKLPDPILRKKIHPLNFLVFGLMFIILIGSILLFLPYFQKPGANVAYVDTLFIAASASTVTGLSSVDVLNTFSTPGHILILILINLGGLGYMTIISFFFFAKNTWGLKYANFVKESLNVPSVGEILHLAKKVFLTIIAFEAAGIGLLYLVWRHLGLEKGLWMATFHGMSAFNNAGFDLMGSFKSFTEYNFDFLLNFAIMALIFLGGIGFLVISDILQVMKGQKRGLALHSKIVLITSLILIIFGAVGFFIFENNNSMANIDSPVNKGLISLFQSVSARTAGFNTINLDNLAVPTLLLLCFLMFIGASPGGTGAGIKTSTLAVLVLWFFSSLENKQEPEAFGRRINYQAVHKALLMFFSSVATVWLFIFVLTIIEPSFKLSQIIFEVFSAFGTVGLSTGITPLLSGFSKIALTILMFIGRITPLAIINILTTNSSSRISYPEEEVSIG